MAYRSEIERALNEMISDETGMRFQGLAVVHGQKKWPQLVACERKWDGGLDAHAKGVLQSDGKGIGLASSVGYDVDLVTASTGFSFFSTTALRQSSVSPTLEIHSRDQTKSLT